jgi:Na+/H+ antiporter
LNFIQASILILTIAILSVPLATRLRIPLEIFLFLGSCLISFLPGLPLIRFDPIIVFDLFLPPILFSAAYFTSWRDFKFNLRPITQLALGLVIFTAGVVALIAKQLFPALSWAEAFLLGAILSPTDASAVVSIIKKFNVPKRLIVLIEGESLVNDATALTLYRFSLIAILYGSFSFADASIQFLFIAAGGVIIGLSSALIGVYILKHLENTQAETAFTFIVAFASYLLAEELGCSGVIATVVAGLYFGIHLPEVISSPTKINAKATWATFRFIINGFVFTLIGLELPSVIANLGNYDALSLFLYGMAISLTVTGTRLIWIYPSAFIPRFLFPVIRRKDPMPSWKILFIIGWTGMRGIVSLAAALAVPREMIGGVPNSHLDLLIFLAYFAIVFTLILPAVTLPFLLRFLNVTDASEQNEKLQQEASARIQAIDEVIKAISETTSSNQVSPQVKNEFIEHIKRKREVIHTQVMRSPYSVLHADYMAYKKLVLTAIEAERRAFIILRKTGKIDDEVFWTLSDELDIEELRANSLRI